MQNSERKTPFRAAVVSKHTKGEIEFSPIVLTHVVRPRHFAKHVLQMAEPRTHKMYNDCARSLR